MLSENTKQVNRILAKNFLLCALMLGILLIANFLGLFSFGTQLVIIILCVGFLATLMPQVLIMCNAPDTFIKYYIHIIASLFIGVVGMSNSIGIYITYIFVPIVSCLYFDKKFTVKIGVISYFIMALSVYVNCRGKYEVIFMNWTPNHTYLLYMIGFTIEYVIVMIFLYQIVSRAQTFMELQNKTVTVLQREKERRQEMIRVYKDSLTDQRKTAYSMLSNEANNFTGEEIAEISSGQQFITQLQEEFNYNQNFGDAMMKNLGLIGNFFNVDRIFCMEISLEEQRSAISYQWVRNGRDMITNFPSELSKDEYEKLCMAYDMQGYLEYLKGENKEVIENQENYTVKVGIDMYNKILGAQLWVPIMSGGMYSGAICFDRYKNKKYSIVEKILFTEVVGMVSNNIMRVNAMNANKAKSTFLSTMSHEIRTPMNAIIGMTTVALREEMNDTVRNSLQTIRSSGESLLSLINDILDFSKIESGRIDIVPEDYQILSVINDVNTLIKARNGEKGLNINFEIDKNLPSVLNGDFVRIRQAMVNFGTNAVKYTDKGSVTVRISMEKKEHIGILHYEVEDTGQGIKEEDIKKLFHSFSQVNVEKNHHTEGSGLGLAITKQLIELMNGHINVTSEYGKGSCFSFDVPQVIVDETPAGNLEDFTFGVEEENHSFKAPGAKVLVVDDTKINLKVAEMLFKPFEFDIETAENGIEAVELSKKKKYDMILMDHFMPEMDGVEATKVIRADDSNPNKESVIIALTADAVSGAKEEMIEAGMDEFLDKPININNAEKMFRRFLQVN